MLLDDENDNDNDDDEEEKLHVPSVSSIVHAALNMLLLWLVTLFLFFLCSAEYASSSSSSSSSSDHPTAPVLEWIGPWLARLAAPTFPLLLFVYYVLWMAWFPLAQRLGFWVILSQTLMAPWSEVTFRDGFVGDVLTSSVRPAQDIAFTIVYVVSGLQGWWSPQQYGNASKGSTSISESFLHRADASVPTMEKSWMLHTVVLPMWYVSCSKQSVCVCVCVCVCLRTLQRQLVG